jgi:pimeloyl-ACP methyl ester carboxylesterase
MKSYPPLPQALAALQSDATVTCSRQRLAGAFLNTYYYLFTRAGAQPAKALVLYPGGVIDPRSYAPLARAIAAHGFAVALVGMPLDLALLGSRRAGRVMDNHPDIKKWAVGGHSLGGVAACAFAGANTGRVAGVVLWASYPSSTFRLDTTHLPAVSIYGTHDGLTTVKKVDTSRQHLPDGTGFVAIEGGNHSQFCSIKAKNDLYRGDNAAAVSREEQYDRIIAATVAFLDGL